MMKNKCFHEVVWPSLKRASSVLWDNITTTFSCKSPLVQINLELTSACAYLFSETDTDFTLSVSRLVRVNGTMKVSVDRVEYGEGCIVSSNMNSSQTDVVLTLPASS